MSEVHQKRPKTPRHKSSEDAAAGSLESNDTSEPLIAFIEDHTSFESSMAHDQIASEVRMSRDFNEAALVPIRHKMLSFNDAVLFGFFLLHAEKKLGVAAPAKKFDLFEFYTNVGVVYDRAMDSAVNEYFDDDDDSTEGSEGSVESSGDESEGGAAGGHSRRRH